MNIGFINIPFPFLIVFAIIVLNILSAVGRKAISEDHPTQLDSDEDPELTAYDLLVEAKRRAQQEGEEDLSICVDEPLPKDNSIFGDGIQEESEESRGTTDQSYQQAYAIASKRPFKINLSQLQQAVVMKEILDQPKSLR
jgi:hypothetical protein